MGHFVAEKTVKMMIQSGLAGNGARVGVLGLTFKENCPDLRNSKVVDIVRELESYGMNVLVHDPMADNEEALLHYGITLHPWEDLQDLGALILAVAHADYRQRPAENFIDKLTPGGCLVNVKCILDPVTIQSHGVPFWRL